MLDIGNTHIKWGMFNESGLTECGKSTSIDQLAFKCGRVLVSGSGEYSVAEVINQFPGAQVLEMNQQLMLPIKLDYKTPETLGHDRVANAVAANQIYPNSTTLIIDVGTCVTIDFVQSGTYMGGSIGPGLKMRAQALHTFTAKLPLIEPVRDCSLIGTTTESSMQSGIVNGMCTEIEGMIKQYKQKFGLMYVVITGGDMAVFENALKSDIFADSNLTLKGLNMILQHNAI